MVPFLVTKGTKRVPFWQSAPPHQKYGSLGWPPKFQHWFWNLESLKLNVWPQLWMRWSSILLLGDSDECFDHRTQNQVHPYQSEDTKLKTQSEGWNWGGHPRLPYKRAPFSKTVPLRHHFSQKGWKWCPLGKKGTVFVAKKGRKWCPFRKGVPFWCPWTKGTVFAAKKVKNGAVLWTIRRCPKGTIFLSECFYLLTDFCEAGTFHLNAVTELDLHVVLRWS